MLDTPTNFRHMLHHRHLERIEARLPPYAVKVVDNLRRKDFSKRFLARLGTQVPASYFENAPLAQAIDLCRDLEAFVLKPSDSKNGWGVHSLVAIGDGRYHDILSKSDLGLDELRAVLQQETESLGLGADWMAEELLLPPDGRLAPVDDLKIYAFYGRVNLILHKRNTIEQGEKKPGYKWYYPSWKETRTGKYKGQRDADLQPPSNAAMFLATAEKISSHILAPFMRIDLYDTARGVVVGELSPRPGKSGRFNGKFHTRLVTAWQDAETRLLEGMEGWQVSDTLRLYRSLLEVEQPLLR